MANDEPYGLISSDGATKSKKLQQALNPKTNNPTQNELLDSVSTLIKKFDTMQKLFTDAANELKIEEKEDYLNDKMDKIMDQNNIIAGGIIAISKMIEDLSVKQEAQAPKNNFPAPSFQSQGLEPQFNELLEPEQHEFPEPVFNELLEPEQQELPEPFFNDVPEPKQNKVSQPPLFTGRQIPSNPRQVMMPNTQSFNPETPKRKGLFGIFKK